MPTISRIIFKNCYATRAEMNNMTDCTVFNLKDFLSGLLQKFAKSWSKLSPLIVGKIKNCQISVHISLLSQWCIRVISGR